jgi:flagellar hook-associated protein 3 FlgL
MRVPTVTQFRDQIELLSQQYEDVSKLQAQADSGQKLQNSSDDPVLALQIKSVSDYITSLQSYSSNGILAQNRSKLFETSAQNVVDIMSKVNELTKAAQNDTLSDADRQDIAAQLQGCLNQLSAAANTQDGNGDYIYAGFNTNSPAYSQENGSYQYLGTADSIAINIGPNVSIPYSESGYSVFGNIPSGNGNFTIAAASTNTGTGNTSAGNIVSTSSYVPDTYTVSFVTNSAGQLAYQVTGAASGQVIPPPPATSPADAPAYMSNSDMTFNGVNIHFNGTPNIGDTFQVAPSQPQNVFNSLQGLINNLKVPIVTDTDRAQFHQAITESSESLSQAATHFIGYLSTVGTREVTIDTQVASNERTITNQKVVLGKLADADSAEVISSLTEALSSLQATQQIYLKIQQTLFELMKMSM